MSKNRICPPPDPQKSQPSHLPRAGRAPAAVSLEWVVERIKSHEGVKGNTRHARSRCSAGPLRGQLAKSGIGRTMRAMGFQSHSNGQVRGYMVYEIGGAEWAESRAHRKRMRVRAPHLGKHGKRYTNTTLTKNFREYTICRQTVVVRSGVGKRAYNGWLWSGQSSLLM